MKISLSALCLPLLLASALPAHADATNKIKATRSYQLCLIQKQQERDVKGRPLLDRSYEHYRSIHTKAYALLASSLRIMERDLSRNMMSLIAYEAIPDFVLEQMDPKPGFYNLARAMISLRDETREFLMELGLDPADPVLKQPMISRKDIFSISSKLKNAPAGSPEMALGFPFYLSPSLRLADDLMKRLSRVIVPTEEGFSLHTDVYTNPQDSLDQVNQAKTKALEDLGKMDQDLRNWTSWGGGDQNDCAEELRVLQATPLQE